MQAIDNYGGRDFDIRSLVGHGKADNESEEQTC